MALEGLVAVGADEGEDAVVGRVRRAVRYPVDGNLEIQFEKPFVSHIANVKCFFKFHLQPCLPRAQVLHVDSPQGDGQLHVGELLVTGLHPNQKEKIIIFCIRDAGIHSFFKKKTRHGYDGLDGLRGGLLPAGLLHETGAQVLGVEGNAVDHGLAHGRPVLGKLWNKRKEEVIFT